MGVAVALCALYLVVRPASQDFASGDFRAHLFRRGAFVWNNLWFGGHSLAGYGVLPPMLGGILGVVPLAMISVLVATWCFILLVERWFESHGDSRHEVLGVSLFAFGCAANLWGGRLTFAPAVMFGTACVLAVQRGRPVPAVLMAFCCGLSSPVGALSLLVILGAMWLASAAPRSTVVAVSLASVLPSGLAMAAFPERGWFPFTWGGLTVICGAVGLVGWFGRHIKLLRWLAIVYGLVISVAFAIRSPLGGNVVRLGWLGAGPAMVLTIRSRRRAVFALVAASTLLWNLAYLPLAFQPAVAVAGKSFYEPLIAYLETVPQPTRVEVVATETFGQASYVALQTSGIARGWETQVDRLINPEMYTGELNAATYHAWLIKHAVSFVALPASSVQQRSRDEAAVIRARPAYLHERWSSVDWQVYEVVDAAPLADNGAVVTDVQPESLTIQTTRRGWTEVKFRYTDLYRTPDGVTCLEASPDGWIRMFVDRVGRVELTIGVSAAALLNRTTDCD